jgi:two-component system, OmpR family, alkaline phosphatase synthesis response regulator PhoP
VSTLRPAPGQPPGRRPAASVGRLLGRPSTQGRAPHYDPAMASGSNDRQLVLVVEDEPNIASFARMYLEAAGYKVTVATRGDDGLKIAEQQSPALIVLDLMLPGIDGFEFTRRLRQSAQTPIIMLTARDDAVDKVVGLELGADDYLTKPFNPRELVARVRAVLRRTEVTNARQSEPEPAVHELAELRIEVGGREVYVSGELIPLTPKEFDLLVTLIEHRGLVLSREQLLERVWGYTFLGDSRTIDVHVRQLRRKLGEACPITTVWGTGYKVAAGR